MFTDLPIEEIVRLEHLRGADINEAKSILATEITRLCHGDGAARDAVDTAAKAFSGAAAEGLPTLTLEADAVLNVLDVVVSLGMATSKSEARRLIEQGGVKVNDRAVQSATASLSAANLDASGMARISVGKKRHGIVKRA